MPSNRSINTGPAATARTSRLRLIVLQALIVALFVTLGARLYYLQVSHGNSYQAQAASQSKREVVQEPARGLIVDDMGRPLAANRTAWVVSVDQSVLDKLDDGDRAELLHRVARATGVTVKKINGDIADWNGSTYQPVPVAHDVKEKVALRILEQPEDYPGVIADQETVRSYPRPMGVLASGVLGYLSPITSAEYKEAQDDGDRSVNANSVVGRAGVEKEYDQWLRGMPGYTSVAVDSLGREIGQGDSVPAQPGDTLVTSIDSKVQREAEKQLHTSIATARHTWDPVTHQYYKADSGAAVVMEAKTGRIVAMASQPNYDPGEWVGGITQKQLDRLYSKKAGLPLLFRATQGQAAPGSTWKPFMTVGALNSGFTQNSEENCSSGLQVGNRWFKNYESESYGDITFAKALQVSCDTFFYRVGLHFWNKYGSDPKNVDAKDPLVAAAKKFGFGQRTGVDLPGEADGRVADRKWKRAYYEAMRGYYCAMDKKGNAPSAYLQLFSHEFCAEGWYYRAGDAVNFAIGQGDTLVTPLQLARAYAALSNGGTLYEPRIGRAIVGNDGTVLKNIKPKVQSKVPMSASSIKYVNQALLGTPETGTLAWKFSGFPLDKIHIRGKTGTAEVEGKQTTGWVATYDKNYVVIMTISQGGTGSGSVGDSVRKIWESLYGVNGSSIDPKRAAIPGGHAPRKLPIFARDGSISPPPGIEEPGHAEKSASTAAEEEDQ